MFLFCLVFAMFCARLFICASWSPAGKGLTSWLSFVVSSVSLSLSHGYNINVLQQTACLVVNPITVGNFAFLFNCTQVGRTSDSMMVPT